MIDYLIGWTLGAITATCWTAIYYRKRYHLDTFEPDGSPSPEQGLNNNAPERSDKQDNENH